MNVFYGVAIFYRYAVVTFDVYAFRYKKAAFIFFQNNKLKN